MLIFGLFGPYFEKTGEEEQFASTRPGGFAAGKNQEATITQGYLRNRLLPSAKP